MDLLNTIGGADGPATVTLAGALNIGWINLFGIIILLIMAIPHIGFAIRHKELVRTPAGALKDKGNPEKTLTVIGWIGRWGAVILMIIGGELTEPGFSSLNRFIAYLIGNAALLIMYCIAWAMFCRSMTDRNRGLVDILTFAIFLLCGVTLGSTLLITYPVLMWFGKIPEIQKQKSGH